MIPPLFLTATQPTQTCEDCYYFIKADKQNSNDRLIGHCHVNPPEGVQLKIVTGTTTQKGMFETQETVKQTIALFPLVLSTMWCGMWQNNTEEKEKQ